jgi:hypothetical protein
MIWMGYKNNCLIIHHISVSSLLHFVNRVLRALPIHNEDTWEWEKDCSSKTLSTMNLTHNHSGLKHGSVLRDYHKYGLSPCPIVFKTVTFIVILISNKWVCMGNFVPNHHRSLYNIKSDFNYILHCNNLNDDEWLT